MTIDKKFRHLDLFSGIGGFALAASWVWGEDHEIVSFCEIEPYPQKVLKKHWPDVPCHGDIKTLKGDSFGTIDLITGGFPCQPFSVAGKQGGSSDDRHLWPEMFRVIQEAKPTWIIGENVAGLANMVEFEQCFLDLESEGYETQPVIIPACATDAKHRRDRVWILASNAEHLRSSKQKRQHERSEVSQGGSGNRLAPRENVADNEKRTNRTYHPGEEERQKQKPRESSGGRNVPDPESNQDRRIFKQKLSPDISSSSDRGRKAKGWAVEPSVGRVANGVPSRVDRLKGLGNAIVPQCVVPIMQSIREISCQK